MKTTTMHHKELFLTVVALLAMVVLLGCSDGMHSNTASEELVASQPIPQLSAPKHVIKFGTPEGATSAASLSGAERQQLLERMSTMMMAFSEAVVLASDWQEADQNVRALLNAPSELSRHYREQAAANAMFQEWLLEGDASPEKLKATAFYTGLLVQNRSPQAATILPALERLQGHWPEAKIAEAAATAARAARAEYEEAPSEAQRKMNQALKIRKSGHAVKTLEAADLLEAISRS